MIKEKELLNSERLNNVINDLFNRIINNNEDFKNIAIIGIKRRGAILVNRIKEYIKNMLGIDITPGYLDITLYRDDLTEIADVPLLQGTEIDFDVKNKTIILIDDVIYTGRTIRAAIDAIIDLGRPKKIILAVLIDRDHRELPIQPDYTGKFFETKNTETINVNLKELDGIDSVTLGNFQ